MALSPMMQQYNEMVQKYPDCIIFFRLGDFYEMFFEQAKLCSRELELTLTGKECGEEERAPMCGIPFHSVNPYISKMVEKGYKVAICEQIEDPKLAKGLVARDIVRIVTPGTVTENSILSEEKNNYVANVVISGKECALSYADISTGECFVTVSEDIDAIYKIIDELIKIEPKELVLDEDTVNNVSFYERYLKKVNIYISRYENLDDSKVKEKNILPQGLTPAEEKSLTNLLNYIFETQKDVVSQINNINKYYISKYMRLDKFTRRNLELTETIREKTKKGSLLWVLDNTNTAIGARQLRKWLENPLLDITEINERLQAVEVFKNNFILREDIQNLLKAVYDIERLSSKIAGGQSNARDLIALKMSIEVLPFLKQKLIQINSKDINSRYISKIIQNIDSLEDVYKIIDDSIIEDPPITIKEGGIIKSTYNEEIKELRSAKTEGKNWIMAFEAKEREETGIKGLKIGFNRVFGYYIEITKSNFSDIPEGRYIRKQTLIDKERFITQELKEIEDKILGCTEKLIEIEYGIFNDIRAEISKEITRIQKSAEMIGIIDSLCSFATIAEAQGYVKPEMTTDEVIEIKDGRHPIVEKQAKNEAFIPNDTYMSEKSKFHIITGPNMSGKSTYMRQIAIITYMAQIGSFVPACAAKIGIVDRIFTRVGASDDLAGGESTFMVEMMELAEILDNATEKSLIVLDEIGRGTSTYDGMAIAEATIEYICEKVNAKTLFATHYHELKELENKFEQVKNYSVEVKEKGEDVIFLRKIIEGPTDESYGIHVAKLAGVPNPLVTRAKTILKKLELENTKKNAKNNDVRVVTETMQVDMFNYKLAEVGRMLDKIAVDELSAKDALDVIYKLKDKMK